MIFSPSSAFTVRLLGELTDDAAINSSIINRTLLAATDWGRAVVDLPSGSCPAYGLAMQPGVWLRGNGTRLILPDGGASGLIGSPTAGALGSITAGSKSLTITSEVKATMVPGATVGIVGAGADGDQLYTVILSASGDTLTLVDPAQTTVDGAVVTAGIVGAKITGLELDGNKDGVVSNTPLAHFGYAREIHLDDLVVRNARAGITFAYGTRQSSVSSLRADGCGVPSSKLGMAVNVWRGASYNEVDKVQVYGDCYHGVVLDDSTVTTNNGDGYADGNRVSRVTVTPDAPAPEQAGVVLGGCRHSRVSDVVVMGVRSALVLNEGPHGRLCQDNRASGITAVRCHNGVVATTVGTNRLDGFEPVDCTNDLVDDNGTLAVT